MGCVVVMVVVAAAVVLLAFVFSLAVEGRISKLSLLLLVLLLNTKIVSKLIPKQNAVTTEIRNAGRVIMMRLPPSLLIIIDVGGGVTIVTP